MAEVDPCAGAACASRKKTEKVWRRQRNKKFRLADCVAANAFKNIVSPPPKNVDQLIYLTKKYATAEENKKVG